MHQNSLSQHDDLLRLVMDNIPQFVFWKDINSIYLGCNMNFAKRAGLDHPQEIIGKSDYELPWAREDADFYRLVDRRVMDSGKPEINFEEPQHLRDGKNKWLITSKVPLFGEDGRVAGILGTYEDITHRKEMELALKNSAEALGESNARLVKLNAELEQANIDLEQFAYATSHDLQEPLRMIGGFTTLLKKRYIDKLDDQAQEYIDFITKGVTRMSDLIRDVLSYSSIGHIDQIYQAINLNNIVTHKLQDLEQFIDQANAQVSYHLPVKPVKCHPDRLGILFYNLILNGIKFNQSKTPMVCIEHEEREQEWLFIIKDNGIGIESQYQDLIFKPFKRLNKRSEFSGSGIGLSICKRIVSLHKGNIWISSNEYSGTSFLFTIAKGL